MLGKRGENPPLPRNCKRRIRDCICHCPLGWEGAVAQARTSRVRRPVRQLRAKAHCPLFPGRRRTLDVPQEVVHRLREVFQLGASDSDDTARHSHSASHSHSLPIASPPSAQSSPPTSAEKFSIPSAIPSRKPKSSLIQEGREDKTLADSTSATDGTYVNSNVPASGRYRRSRRSHRLRSPNLRNSFTSAPTNPPTSMSASASARSPSKSSSPPPELPPRNAARRLRQRHRPSDLENQHQLNVADALRTLPGPANRDRPASAAVPRHCSFAAANPTSTKSSSTASPPTTSAAPFDFADLSSTAVDQVEILRGPNSVLYGPDAIASVVNVTTPHGTTIEPEFNYSIDGGNFDTFRNDVSVSGAFHQFDYFSEFSRFDTHNSLPNSEFHDATYAGNFGWTPTATTDVRFTVRHTATGLGDSNASTSSVSPTIPSSTIATPFGEPRSRTRPQRSGTTS